ncbi:MAG TPA: orotidine-5'-phosphate decarboxylase [Ktedonobacterales bacterium]
MTFLEKLLAASRRNNSLICIGLDPEHTRLPAHLRNQPDPILAFHQAIIEATADLVCAYKPNLAFYEALGPTGLTILQETLRLIPGHIPTIGDAKRGDTENTSRQYARALFETYGFDAITVNPYLGSDSLQPFLEYREKGVLILCRTSNPGARNFQDMLVSQEQEQPAPLYEYVARQVLKWNTAGNAGLVVGATYPEELQRIRQIAPDLPILIPGVGAQGGDLASAARDGTDAAGERAIISVSRAIIYASNGRDFAESAAQAARALRDSANQARRQRIRQTS